MAMNTTNKIQESDTKTNVNAASVSESVGESETALRLRILQLETRLTAAQARTADKDEICHLLASAWYHGRWRAETFNEKRMEEIMVRLGFWPTTQEKLLVGRAAIDAARQQEARHD